MGCGFKNFIEWTFSCSSVCFGLRGCARPKNQHYKLSHTSHKEHEEEHQTQICNPQWVSVWHGDIEHAMNQMTTDHAKFPCPHANIDAVRNVKRSFSCSTRAGIEAHVPTTIVDSEHGMPQHSQDSRVHGTLAWFDAIWFASTPKNPLLRWTRSTHNTGEKEMIIRTLQAVFRFVALCRADLVGETHWDVKVLGCLARISNDVHPQGGRRWRDETRKLGKMTENKETPWHLTPTFTSHTMTTQQEHSHSSIDTLTKGRKRTQDDVGRNHIDVLLPCWAIHVISTRPLMVTHGELHRGSQVDIAIVVHCHGKKGLFHGLDKTAEQVKPILETASIHRLRRAPIRSARFFREASRPQKLSHWLSNTRCDQRRKSCAAGGCGRWQQSLGPDCRLWQEFQKLLDLYRRGSTVTPRRWDQYGSGGRDAQSLQNDTKHESACIPVLVMLPFLVSSSVPVSLPQSARLCFSLCLCASWCVCLYKHQYVIKFQRVHLIEVLEGAWRCVNCVVNTTQHVVALQQSPHLVVCRGVVLRSLDSVLWRVDRPSSWVLRAKHLGNPSVHRRRSPCRKKGKEKATVRSARTLSSHCPGIMAPRRCCGRRPEGPPAAPGEKEKLGPCGWDSWAPNPMRDIATTTTSTTTTTTATTTAFYHCCCELWTTNY